VIRAWLARILAFALVPVLVVTLPEPARAASTLVAIGDTATARWSVTSYYDGPLDARTASCTATGNLRLNSAGVHTVRAIVRCKFGFNFEFDDAVNLKAYGTGENCALVADYVPLKDDEDTDTTLAPVTLRSVSQGRLPGDCSITTLRVNHYESGYCHTGLGFTQGDAGDEDDYCDSGYTTIPWRLGPPPEDNSDAVKDDGSCPLLTMSRSPRMAKNEWAQFSSAWGSYAGKWSRELRYIFPSISWKSGVAQPSSTTPMTFNVGYVYRNRSTGKISLMGTAGTYSAPPQSSIPQSERSDQVKYGDPVPTAYQGKETPDSAQQSTDPYELIGVQLFTYNAWWDRADSPTVNSAGYTGRGAFDFRLPQDATGGDLGLSDRGACRFYFGPKIATAGVEAQREPVSPLAVGERGSAEVPDNPISNPEPEDKSDGACKGFKLTDPSSWAGAGICMLVRLFSDALTILSNILRAIGNLAGTIAGAIADALGGIVGALLDGLSALFVPSGAHFTSSIQSVQDSWSDTAPGQVTKTYTRIQNRLSAPSDMGCAGPTMAVSLPFVANKVRLNPMSSCSEPMAKVARFTRVALLIGVYIAALMLCARIIASAIGLKTHLGGADD